MGKKVHRQPEGQKASLPASRLVLIGGAILALAGIALFVLSQQAPPYTPEVTGAPRAELDQTAVDHGDVRYNTPVSSVFTVSNIGDQPLVILGEPQVEVVEGC